MPHPLLHPLRRLQPAVRLALRGVFRAVLPRAPRAESPAPAPASVAEAEAAARPAHRSLAVWDHHAREPALAAAPARPSHPGRRDLPRILLLNPPRYHGIPVVRLYRSEYLFVQGNHIPAVDLGYFAARAKGRAELLLVDANAEGLDDDAVLARARAFAPDVIVVKGVRNLLAHDLRVAERYKHARPHTRVVLSCRGCVGAEPQVFEHFPFVDGIARGEVDAFAEDLADGGPLAGVPGMSVAGATASLTRVVAELDAVPMPDLEAMPPIWYTGYKFPYYGVPSGYYVITARGCPYACTFCMVGGAEDRPFRYRRRSPANVVDELALVVQRFGLRDVYFFDEIFTMPGHTERICELILSRGLRLSWTCEGKPDLVRPAMLALMKRAGCKAIYFGIESGDDRILGDVEKGHTSAQAARAIQMTQAAGILAATYVTIGFPNETWASYLKTIGFLLDSAPDMVRYGFLTPYPITVLHRQMKEAGLLLGDLDHSDRRISPFHDAPIALRTRHLGPWSLRVMDALLKHTFSAELARTPLPAVG